MIDEVKSILNNNDGSLPDIEFDFNGEVLISKAYELIQSWSSGWASTTEPHYWSRKHKKDVNIKFGYNPSEHFLNDEIDAFHVVFSGIKSKSGKLIPELGLYILEKDFISLDYKMGMEWTGEAIIGLFELMSEIKSLSTKTTITCQGNIYDPKCEVLLSSFNRWEINTESRRSSCT